MESKYKQATIAFLTLFLLFGLVSGFQAQETDRKKVSVSGQATATPTPGRGVTGVPSPTPVPTFTPPVPLPSPLSDSGESESVLKAKIYSVLNNPLLQRGHIGVKIISLDTGKTVFEQNSGKYFMPASNMKSFTVAAALEKLSPDFRFVTSVYGAQKPEADGVLRGDLIIYGRGDPSISMAFYPGDHLKGLEALADRIIASGVKRVEGDLVGDETYFNSDPVPSGWEWDDLQWYYGAEISSLNINDNALDLAIKPGFLGAPCVVQIKPTSVLMAIVNKTKTVPAGTRRDLRITKKLGENVLEISGVMPVNDNGFNGYIALSRPASGFVRLLRQVLESKGVTFTGHAKAVNRAERDGQPLDTSALTEIARLESPPFSVIAEKTMKPSQNLYTELILRALGEQLGDKNDSSKTSEQRGIEVVSAFLRQAGIAGGDVVQYDGSGLSRHNLITPDSAVALYSYMAKSRHASAWMNSLTIGGVDGTLRNRFKGTKAQANARGKTGTLDQVSALSGYITSASGERFIFSVLTNGVPDSRLRVSTIDDIVVALANFDGTTAVETTAK